jgi:hypothetical protein
MNTYNLSCVVLEVFIQQEFKICEKILKNYCFYSLKKIIK